LTFEQIKELLELVSERDLEGLKLERSGFKLKIDGKKTSRIVETVAAPMAAPVTAAAPVAAPAAPAAAPAVPAAAEASAAGGDQDEPDLPPDAHIVKSPIVGTFYRRPSPDSEPFVSEGDSVKTNQVLCIVEAMKLMNEIESDADGVIAEVYPKNAQPVEFGEPLFAVRAD
jgi:acetyl-CoA carboxylase biotin carboxyl carrier protein